MNSYMKEEKTVERVLESIKREKAVVQIQIVELKTVLATFEGLYFETIRIKLNNWEENLETDFLKITRGYNLMKVDGIPCFHGGCEWLTSLRKLCQSIMFSIYKIKA